MPSKPNSAADARLLQLGDDVLTAVRRFEKAAKADRANIAMASEYLLDHHETLRQAFESVLAAIGLGMEDITGMGISLHGVRALEWANEDTGEVDPAFIPALLDMQADDVDSMAVGWGSNDDGGGVGYTATIWTDACLIRISPKFDRKHFTGCDVIPLSTPPENVFRDTPTAAFRH